MIKKRNLYKWFFIVFIIAIVVIVLVRLFAICNLDRLYGDTLKKAEEYRLYTDEVRFNDYISVLDFNGTDFVDSHINKMKLVLGENFQRITLFPYGGEGIIEDDAFHITVDREFLNGLSSFSYPVDGNLREKLRKIANPIDDFYRDLDSDEIKKVTALRSTSPGGSYRDRYRFVDYLIADILSGDALDSENVEKKVNLLFQSIQFISRETPYLLTALYSMDLYNKYIDLIYLLNLLDRIDDATALSLLRSVENASIDDCLGNAIKNEFHFTVREDNFFSNSSFVSIDAFYKYYVRANQIAVVNDYIHWMQQYNVRYCDLDDKLKGGRSPFPWYLTVAKSYTYPWQDVLLKRDVLNTRIGLIKACISISLMDRQNIDSILQQDEFKNIDSVTGLPPQISEFDSIHIIRSTAVDGNPLKVSVTLFKDTYGKNDMIFVIK